MADRENVLNGLEACADRTGALCRTCPYDFRKEGCISDMAEDALELLKEQPERKHGHWVFDPDGMDWGLPAWRCSECRCRNDNIPPNSEHMNPLQWAGSKYCPNCGAKMDEEVKQDEQNSDIHGSTDIPRL